MLLAGFLSIPFCLLELAFVPEYWDPRRVSGFPLALSDILFSFSTGGLAWVLAEGFRSRPFRLVFEPARFARRYGVSSAVGAGFVIGLWRLGVPIMPAALTGIGVGVIVLAVVFRQATSRMWRGAVGFGLFYALAVKIILRLQPFFLSRWKEGGALCFQVWGVPFGEILWGVAFGAIWPAFIAYIFGPNRTAPQSEADG